MALVLTNTLSGRKEPLRPRTAASVGVYWCGVTVYSRSHIGHARALITADVLCRYLRTRGYGVNFVRNFTDIDDKVIKRAAEEGITAAALTEREIGRFNEDVTWLRCLRPTHEPRATAHIASMLSMIEQLVADGFAYPTPDGSVYFRVRRFPDYGKLSHQRLDDMASSDEQDPSKEDAHDFALWKGAKPGEPQWPSPWGPGRPGWHIECSAMAAEYLGQPFEIHGGGTDLIFPHHENEIAQSEAAGRSAFADLWLHNGMLQSGTEKMSKSLGNIVALRHREADACRGPAAHVPRHALPGTPRLLVRSSGRDAEGSRPSLRDARPCRGGRRRRNPARPRRRARRQAVPVRDRVRRCHGRRSQRRQGHRPDVRSIARLEPRARCR